MLRPLRQRQTAKYYSPEVHHEKLTPPAEGDFVWSVQSGVREAPIGYDIPRGVDEVAFDPVWATLRGEELAGGRVYLDDAREISISPLGTAFPMSSKVKRNTLPSPGPELATNTSSSLNVDQPRLAKSLESMEPLNKGVPCGSKKRETPPK
jgi:hypothetical protein